MVKKSNLGYIYGSTVTSPERIPSNPVRKEEYEKLKKARIERLNRLKRAKNVKKRRIIVSIIAIFMLGMGLIWGEAQVYNTQLQLSSINKQIADIKRENDDLKVELLKVSSIENIKQTAEKKLQMINPDRKNIIYVDLSKDNFSTEPEDNRESKAKEIWIKVKNLLF